MIPVPVRDLSTPELLTAGRDVLAQRVALLQQERLHLTRETERLQAEVAKYERDILGEIDDRDRNAEMADRLAAAIAEITGGNFGEHSSENDPWQNALDFVAGTPRRPGAQAATDSAPKATGHVCDSPGKCWADPDCPIYSSHGRGGDANELAEVDRRNAAMDARSDNWPGWVRDAVLEPDVAPKPSGGER